MLVRKLAQWEAAFDERRRRRCEETAADGAGRDDVVTRPVSLTGETPPFFVDWLSVAQDYPEGGLPEVDAGCVWKADADGVIEWRTVASARHEGSYETSVNVKCDGFRVSVSGNMSRFGRPDNLFGFDLAECFRRVNRVLSVYGLPAFTAGTRIERPSRGDITYQWTGARISRIDLTKNYEAGSMEAAHLVMQYLGTQHNGRKAGRVLGDGETVDWAAGKRQYWKAYLKAPELVRHRTKGEIVDERVLSHCVDKGIVRFEGTIRSNTLTDVGAAFLGDYESGWAMGQLIRLFNEHAQVMVRAERPTDDLDDLAKHLRATARDYLAGMDCKAEMGRASFYRHRRELLVFGIDISMRNVSPFKPRVRVVELAHASVPSWYQLDAA